MELDIHRTRFYLKQRQTFIKEKRDNNNNNMVKKLETQNDILSSNLKSINSYLYDLKKETIT